MPPLTLSAVGIVAASSTSTVVEKRHPHFERVRHRHAVGVVEHVVDEPELGVEEKGVRDRTAVESGGVARHRRSGACVIGAEGSADERAPQRHVEIWRAKGQVASGRSRPRAARPPNRA